MATLHAVRARSSAAQKRHRRIYLCAEPRDLPRSGRRIADVRRHGRQLYHLRGPGADVESRARAVPAKMWNRGHARSRRRCGSDGDRTSASSRCATRQSRSKRTAKLPRHLSPAARRGCLSASSWAPRQRNQRERRGNHAARATPGATGRVLSVQQPRASRMMRAVERHVRRSLPGRVGCALGGVCMCISAFRIDSCVGAHACDAVRMRSLRAHACVCPSFALA